MRMSPFRNGMRAPIVALALACLTGAAQGAMVYGRVYGGGFKAGESFTVASAQKEIRLTVPTDRNRNYAVDLPPGRYRVEYRGRTAEIRSYPQPVQQDIRFK